MNDNKIENIESNKLEINKIENKKCMNDNKIENIENKKCMNDNKIENIESNKLEINKKIENIENKKCMNDNKIENIESKKNHMASYYKRNKNRWLDKIICQICNKKVTRVGKNRHCKTLKHRLKVLQNKIKNSN